MQHLPSSVTWLPALAATLIAASLHGQSPNWSPADLRADLVQLREHVSEREKSYSSDARTLALRRLDALERGIDTVSNVQFELEVSRIIALADNGHSNNPGPMRGARYNRVGIRLVPFGDQFHVVRARDAHADLLGARVVAIGSRPIDAVRSIARQLTGGANNWRDRFVSHFIESPEQLRATGVGTSSERATYEFVLPDGRRVRRELVAEPAPPPTVTRIGTGRQLFPDSTAGDGTPWRTLLDPAKAPWALQESAARGRFRRAPEIDAVVVQLRQNNASPGFDIASFLRAMAESITVVRPQHVVLDMRMNGGGNLNMTRDFVQRLPSSVPGRVFVLTSPWTFSAAISTVGYLEQAAPERVTIVGEEVGDRLEFWAEGAPIALERTGIRLGTATERHDYANACRGYTDCHGSVVRHPIAVKSLAPDLPAALTIEAYRAGRDPGMEAVAAALGRR